MPILYGRGPSKDLPPAGWMSLSISSPPAVPIPSHLCSPVGSPLAVFAPSSPLGSLPSERSHYRTPSLSAPPLSKRQISRRFVASPKVIWPTTPRDSYLYRWGLAAVHLLPGQHALLLLSYLLTAPPKLERPVTSCFCSLFSNYSGVSLGRSASLSRVIFPIFMAAFRDGNSSLLCFPLLFPLL